MPSAPKKASLLVVFLTVFIDLLGFGMVLPLLPLYGKQFAVDYDFSKEQTGWVIGLLLASFSAMQFLFVPVWGRLSDRIGRRPVLIVGLVGSTVFYALFGVAAMGRSLVGLFVARIGAGIAGATIATAQAYIADVTTPEKRARGMALIGAAFALGFTLGPLLCGVVLLARTEATLSPWPGFVAAGLSAAAMLLAIFRLQESRQGDGATSRPLFDGAALRAALATPSVALLIASSFIAVFSFANMESTLSLLVDKIAAEHQTGQAASSLLDWAKPRVEAAADGDPDRARLIVVLAIFCYLGLVLTLAQGFLVRRLAGKLPEVTLCLGGGLAAIAGFALSGWAAAESHLGWVIAGLAIEVTGFAFVTPTLNSLISRRTSPDDQGGILGLAQSASSLARIAGPVVGNRLFAAHPSWPFWAATGLLTLGLLLVALAGQGGKDYGKVMNEER